MAVLSPLDLHATADPSSVGVLRRQVKRWLADVIDDPDLRDDLVLAVSEAVENVVDHAFAGTSRAGTVWVRARDDGRRVVFTVLDDGRWQDSNGHGYRGRGLALIAGLAEECDVVTGPEGTTVTLAHHYAAPSVRP